jgi:Cep192 domain 4
MMKPAALLLVLVASQASAQLALYTVQSGADTQVTNGQFVQFGSLAAGWEASDVAFILQYTGPQPPYYLNYFHLQEGTPFSILKTDWSTLPAVFPASGLSFTVHFQPTLASSYSAKLELYGTQGVDDITIVLTGTAFPGFTPSATGLNFGNVQVGSQQTQNLTLTNNNVSAPLTLDGIVLQGGGDFHLASSPAAGATVPASTSVNVAVVFAPTTAGPQTGALTIGLYSVPLTGTGTAPPPPPFPEPGIQLDLPTAASGQQGKLSVNLASASPADGSGTVTLDFQPSITGFPDDPMVAFSDNTRAAAFSVAKGATAAQFASNASLGFQTGTTAGTLTFTVQLGTARAQASVTIPPAVVATNPLVAQRNVGCVPADLYCNAVNIQLQIDGWDNTRSVSQAVFRFFNQSGQEISPGDITWNGGAPFQSYFANSTLGGEFELRALFPINGDGTQVTAAEVTITNSAGNSQTARVQF